MNHYEESVGFAVRHHTNWLDYCYSDQFSVGFDTAGGGIYKNCFCWWYSDKERVHLAMRSQKPFYGSIDTLTVGGAHHAEYPNRFMEEDNVSKLANIVNVTILSDSGKPFRVK